MSNTIEIDQTPDRIEEYYNNPALNQSFLKAIDKGPFAIKKYLEYGEKNYGKKTDKSLLIGAAVDCLLTNPHNFYKEFCVIPSDKPSDAIIGFIEQVYKKGILTDNIDVLAAELVTVAKENNYGSNWKDETLLAKMLREENFFYYNFIIHKDQKYAITVDELEMITQLADKVAHSEYCNHFYDVNNYPRLQSYFQVPFYVELLPGIQCKVLLDQLIINTGEEITLPNGYTFPKLSMTIIDYKYTSFKLEECSKAAKKFKYPTQGAFYFDVVKTIFPNWTINNPVLIYYNEYTDYTVWQELSDDDLQIGRFGAIKVGGVIKPSLENLHTEVLISGYMQMIEKYQAYLSNDNWNVEYKTLENNGKQPSVYQQGGII